MDVHFLFSNTYWDRVVGNLEHAWKFSNARNLVPPDFGDSLNLFINYRAYERVRYFNFMLLW